MNKSGFIMEKDFDSNGHTTERVKLFEYRGVKFMATYDGKLIPHHYATEFLDKLFAPYFDEDGYLIDD